MGWANGGIYHNSMKTINIDNESIIDVEPEQLTNKNQMILIEFSKANTYREIQKIEKQKMQQVLIYKERKDL